MAATKWEGAEMRATNGTNETDATSETPPKYNVISLPWRPSGPIGRIGHIGHIGPMYGFPMAALHPSASYLMPIGVSLTKNWHSSQGAGAESGLSIRIWSDPLGAMKFCFLTGSSAIFFQFRSWTPIVSPP